VIKNHRLFRILLAFLYNFGLGGQDPSRHTYSSSRVTTGGGGGGGEGVYVKSFISQFFRMSQNDLSKSFYLEIRIEQNNS
jgi:hypothetical protein